MRHSRVMRIYFPQPFFEGEGLGGGGGGGGGGGDQGGGDQGGGGGAWKAPDTVPEAYRGATAEETLTKLVGGFTEVNGRAEGLREKLSKLPKAPDTADGYTFEPDDKLKPYFPDPANNPFLPVARAAFHKHGIPNEAFQGIIGDMYAQLSESGVISQPFNPGAEVASYSKAFGLDEKGAAAQLGEAETFAKGLMGQLQGIPQDLQQAAQAELMAMTDTAGGNALLRAMQARLAASGIRLAGTGQPGGELTADEVKKLTADPRIDPANREHSDPAKRYDPELRKRYDAYYQKQAPKQPAF